MSTPTLLTLPTKMGTSSLIEHYRIAHQWPFPQPILPGSSGSARRARVFKGHGLPDTRFLRPAWVQLSKQLHSIISKTHRDRCESRKMTCPVIVLVSLRCKDPRPRGSVNTPFCDTRKCPTFSKMHQHWHGVPNSLDCQGTPERSFMHQTGLLGSSQQYRFGRYQSQTRRSRNRGHEAATETSSKI